ncbi:MAG TPA: acyl-CoA dehydrogenase family protein [Pseudonocardia sp.]|uniref:acyl-CoA dehydrogenase family protein n=1 Tax=Pseudonocardia sp. TaxID=60912 RepID=UPI002C51AF60|nr:acyl-CoA dehydrogenase family protein [Pseudonocardia sp.]HTF49634.1 acyl-CoA dehydrogenase family protein [Pseudonocardia sp.]
MDFSPTEAQSDLAELTRRILADQVTQERLRKLEDGPDRFDPALWSVLADAGVLAAALPESVGGSGFGVLEQCTVLVELGRAVAPVPYLPSIVLAGAALAEFGDDGQRERWVLPVAQGRLVLTAALESGAPGAVPGPAGAVAAVPGEGGGWVLNGTVVAVPAGPIADLILVPADTPDGRAVFLVEPDDAGVSVARQRTVDLDSAGLLELADVALPADRVLGGVHGGAHVADWLAARATVGLCAFQLGVTERALELTAEYARTRVQFGRPIGGFQAVAQRLADAYVDVQAIRLTLWQAAWRLSTGQAADAELATAKFWAADAGHRVAHTAVHVHGGVGIDTDHPLHRYFVAAKRAEFALGGATEQLLRLGELLPTE